MNGNSDGKSGKKSGQSKCIFGICKVNEKGQIVIPKEAREVFGIQAGDTLLILGDEANGILVTKPEVIHAVARRIFETMEQSEAKE